MKVPFRMNARTVKYLGEQNVPSDEAAIVELVKNSYDADARWCHIVIDTSKPVSAIYIIDNGVGMTQDEVISNWMTIGTVDKLRNSAKNKREQTGSMGIGRLALDRLGALAEMYTQANQADLVCWNINWTLFSDTSKSFSDIEADIKTSERNYSKWVKSKMADIPFEIEDLNELGNRGTLIAIYDLKTKWTINKFDKLFSTLRQVAPPVSKTEFGIYLDVVSEPNRYGLAQSQVVKDFDYKVEANFTTKNVLLHYYRNELDVTKLPNSFFEQSGMGNFPFDSKTFQKGDFEKNILLSKLLPGLEDTIKSEDGHPVGPFSMTLYFAKRTAGTSMIKYPYRVVDYELRKLATKNLDGISIYRDFFRVRPYGDRSSALFDWLGLQDRAAKSPAAPASSNSGPWRVRAQQISGVINISRRHNSKISDLPNRQGLINNQEFETMVALILGVISDFERDRQKIFQALRSAIEFNNPKKSLQSRAKSIAKKVTKNVNSANALPERDVSSDDFQILANAYLDSEKQNDSARESLITENQLLRSMASIGLAAGTFGHELKNQETYILERSKLLRGSILPFLTEDDPRLRNIEEEDNPFYMLKMSENFDAQLVDWMGITLGNLTRDKRRMRRKNLISVIRSACDSWEPILAHTKGIQLSFSSDISEFKIRLAEVDFSSVINNLISNSKEAFEKVGWFSDTKQIQIKCTQIDDGISIKYFDNGPGISKDIEDRERIFDALFTTKKSTTGEDVGSGLGMWIIKSTIENHPYNGRVRLLEPKHGFGIEVYVPLS